MAVFKDSAEQAWRGCLKRADGNILVALNIPPKDLVIINPLYSSGSIVTTPITSKIIKPTPPVMGEWVYTFSQYRYYCFCVIILYYKYSGFLSIYNIYLVTNFATIHESRWIVDIYSSK